MDSPKKILTIDGGGLRGVFAAAIIEQMEKAAGKKPATSSTASTAPAPVPFSPLLSPGA